MALNAPPPAPSAAVRIARVVGACACLGLSLNVFLCVMRERFADPLAWGPFAVFGPLLAVSLWICRAEFVESFRSARMKVALHVFIQAALGMIVLAAFWYACGYRFHARFDLASNDGYALHEESLRVLGALAAEGPPVEIVVLHGELPADPEPRAQAERLRAQLQALLERYEREAEARAPGRLAVSTLRMLQEPARLNELGKRMGLKVFTPDLSESLAVLKGERVRLVSRNELFVRAYTPEGVPVGGGFHGEAALTAALRLIQAPQARAVYFTQGHGERVGGDLSLWAENLRLQNFEVRELDLAAGSAVPADAAAVVVAGPRERLRPEALAALKSYLDAGGRLLALLDPVVPNLAGFPREASGLAELLEPHGLRVRQDLLTRGVRPALVGDPLPLERLPALPASQTLPVRALIEARMPVFLAHPCAVEALPKPALSTVEALPLLATPPYETREARHWADPAAQSGARSEAGPQSLKGPVPLAAASAPKGVAGGRDAPGARILVLAGSDAFLNPVLERHTGNQLFALAAVAWLAGAEDAGVAIPPRSPDVRLAEVSDDRLQIFKALFLAGLPAGLVFLGMAVWAARRT